MSLNFPYKKILCNTLVMLAVITFTGIPSLDAKPRDKERWDKKYGTEVYIFGKEPVPFLKQNAHLLPKGKALDIAIGEGRNGVYLATLGFDVLGLDISEKGLAKAHQLAKKNGVTIKTRVVRPGESSTGKECLRRDSSDVLHAKRPVVANQGSSQTGRYGCDRNL